jgi:hypothetical protein
MPKSNPINRIFTFLIISLTTFTVFSTNLNVNAQLGLEPFGINKSDPKENGWFKYTVDPGTTIEDFVVISNVGAEETSVDLRSNDAIITDDGAFTIISNELENKEVGNWVQLTNNTVDVPAGKGVKVPFKINIPANVKPGEYAGGLSITELEKDDGSTAPLSVKTRIGNRIYITVRGNINISSTVKDLEIINPNVANFNDELRKRGFIQPENIVFKFTAENTGDVYTALSGGFKMILPDGKEINQTFTRNMGPRSGPRTFYIETNVPYQVGKTVLNFDYTTKPQNELKDSTGVNYNYSNDKGSLSFTFDLTDKQLQDFKNLVAKPEDIKPTKNNQNNSASNQPLITGSAPAPQPAPQVITNQIPADNTMIIYIGIGLGLLLLILIALVAYKLISDSKKTGKKETK